MSLVPLPIDEIREPFEAALFASRCVILEAPPGAGKTTRVPAWLLQARERGQVAGKILVLEPRRIAARASAERVASEHGERAGERIGYRVRFDEKVSAKTEVEFITEGILTRRFQTDAFLDGVGAVVLDEVHERSLHTDLALGFLRELLEVRDDLLVVVMSATLDGDHLSRFLHDAPIVKSEGRMFPVEVESLPSLKGRDERRLEDKCATAIFSLIDAADDDGGDILAFLPGAAEIERTKNKVQARARAIDVCPLYGALPFPAQQKALRKGTQRRVVLATNIAETSLTVEGVTAVVDSGLKKAARYDPATGLDRLDTVKVSQASAAQRAGRAGRVAKGRVVRLYSDAELQSYRRFDPPELLTVDLAPVVLALCSFAQTNPANFALPDPLPESKVDEAVALLRTLGALEDTGFGLTPLGKALAALPVHPRVGAVLLAGRSNGLEDEAAGMAAILSERDVLTASARRELPRHDNDVLYRLDLVESGGRGAVEPAAAKQVRQVERQLSTLARRAPKLDALRLPPDCRRPLATLLLAGYPDRVCLRRDDDKTRAVMVGRRGVKRDGRTGVHAELFIAPAIFGGSGGGSTPSGAKEAVVTLAAALDQEDLTAALPRLVTREVALAWDAEREAVVQERQERFADLVLKAHREGMPKKGGNGDAAEAVTMLLFEHARQALDRVMPLSGDLEKLAARLAFAKEHLGKEETEVERWPSLFDAGGREALLRAACEGSRSFSDLEKVNFAERLLQSIPWRLRALLDDKVPAKIEVPSGSKIAVDYAAALGDAGAPVLAVRLQEVFGWERTPTIVNVPVLMHLLGPNYRPVQVTRDLENFWNTTYNEVRKELRQRYPKHAWPEDPWNEPATNRGGHRRRR